MYRGDDAGFEDALRRHVSLFNTHPYLSSLALGATIRLEEDGADGATVEAFKAAVRGPLGSLGDSLFWAALLPVCLVFALVLAQLGASAWIVVLAFLVPYNGAHLWIRVWGSGSDSSVVGTWAKTFETRTFRIGPGASPD